MAPTQSEVSGAARKLRSNLEIIADSYSIDTSYCLIPSRVEVWPFKLSVMVLSYILGQNTILVGEPGFGKTVSAKTVASVMTRLPYDLYSATQIQGHPEQTQASLVGRPDFHKLSMPDGGEVTIWNPMVYLPAVVADELPRLPEGKQEMLLDAVDTGRWQSPLNHIIYKGKTPFFATANYPENSKPLLITPMRDRFAVMLELGYLGPEVQEKVNAADRLRTEHLSSPEMVREIMAELREPGNGDADDRKIAAIPKYQERFAEQMHGHGLEPLSNEELCALRGAILAVRMKVPEKNDYAGLLFLDSIVTEMNSTPLYGLKRRSDPIDDSSHAMSLASTKVYNSLSPRGIRAIEEYAKGLAFLQGKPAVSKDEVFVAACMVLMPRIEPTVELQGSAEGQSWGTGGPLQLEAAYRLLAGVEGHYATTKENVATVHRYLSGASDLTPQERRTAEEILATRPDELKAKYDTPLLWHYITAWKNAHKREELKAKRQS